MTESIWGECRLVSKRELSAAALSAYRCMLWVATPVVARAIARLIEWWRADVSPANSASKEVARPVGNECRCKISPR